MNQELSGYIEKERLEVQTNEQTRKESIWVFLLSYIVITSIALYFFIQWGSFNLGLFKFLSNYSPIFLGSLIFSFSFSSLYSKARKIFLNNEISYTQPLISRFIRLALILNSPIILYFLGVMATARGEEGIALIYIFYAILIGFLLPFIALLLVSILTLIFPLITEKPKIKTYISILLVLISILIPIIAIFNATSRSKTCSSDDWNCYARIAIKQDNPLICDQVQAHTSECLHSYAKYKNDISFCNLISNNSYRDSCILDIKKIIIGDINICNSLNAQDSKNFCYGKVAVELKDLSICDKIINSKDGKDSCYTEIATALGDSSICDKIILDEYGDKYEINNCYFNVAKAKQDLSICDKILYLDQKNNCIGVVGRIK